MKESKQAVKMTRLSCHRFRAHEVRLWLSVIAFNLGNLWRRLAFRADREVVANQLAKRLVKTGGRLIKHARYYWPSSSDAAAFREHAAENCDAAGASRIGGLQSTANFGDG